MKIKINPDAKRILFNIKKEGAWFKNVHVKTVKNKGSKFELELDPQLYKYYCAKYSDRMFDKLTDPYILTNPYNGTICDPCCVYDNAIILDICDFMELFSISEDLKFLRHYLAHTPDFLIFLLEDSCIDFAILTYEENEVLNNRFDRWLGRYSSESFITKSKIAKPQILNIDFSEIALKHIELLKCVDRQVSKDARLRYNMIREMIKDEY